ncbi:MAG: spore coat protein [Bacillus sp. (in: Bacteria)]|nr:spore coat protein [Bacillus sp. (in: firmicutes)]
MQNQSQQPLYSQQPGTMSQPPEVVTVKDSLYLNDMLSWNLLAAKKAHHFASQCQNPDVRAELEKCVQMHQRHYQQILSHLNPANQPNHQQMQ